MRGILESEREFDSMKGKGTRSGKEFKVKCISLEGPCYANEGETIILIGIIHAHTYGTEYLKNKKKLRVPQCAVSALGHHNWMKKVMGGNRNLKETPV